MNNIPNTNPVFTKEIENQKEENMNSVSNKSPVLSQEFQNIAENCQFLEKLFVEFYNKGYGKDSFRPLLEKFYNESKGKNDSKALEDLRLTVSELFSHISVQDFGKLALDNPFFNDKKLVQDTILNISPLPRLKFWSSPTKNEITLMGVPGKDFHTNFPLTCLEAIDKEKEDPNYIENDKILAKINYRYYQELIEKKQISIREMHFAIDFGTDEKSQDVFIAAIAQMLKNNKDVNSLCLEFYKCKDDYLLSIADAMISNTKIKTISFTADPKSYSFSEEVRNKMIEKIRQSSYGIYMYNINFFSWFRETKD